MTIQKKKLTVNFSIKFQAPKLTYRFSKSLVILKCAIPVVCMNNRQRGTVNNTTNNLHDVYRGMKSITTCFGLIWPSSGYIQRVSEICKKSLIPSINIVEIICCVVDGTPLPIKVLYVVCSERQQSLHWQIPLEKAQK